MIKIRLIRLLSHAKKFVLLQVLCQWVSLLCQTAIVFFISDIVQKLFVHESIAPLAPLYAGATLRSEEHTSELQSRHNLVCRLLLEKKKR